MQNNKEYLRIHSRESSIPLSRIFEDDTALPARVVGSYSSSDGGGRFDAQSERDIPWGVYDGEWHVNR